MEKVKTQILSGAGSWQKKTSNAIFFWLCEWGFDKSCAEKFILINRLFKAHLHSLHWGPNNKGDDETKAKKRHHQDQSLDGFKLHLIS